MSATTPGDRGGIGITHASEETTRRMKDTAREKTAQMRQRAMEAADEQKERATGELGAIASALHDAGRRLDEENHPTSRVIHTAADRLDGLAQAIEERNLDELMQDARAWARRSPGLFFGGAIAVGFLASRFLKADGHDEEWETSPYGGDTGTDFSTGFETSTPGNPTPVNPATVDPTGGPYGRS